MAICEACKLEMTSQKTVTCLDVEVEFPGSPPMKAVPYEPIDGGKKRCHDCYVKPGGLHHPGCDAEECPACHGQLISCGCLDADEEDDADE